MYLKSQNVYEFGPFRLLPDEGLLLREARPVPLSPKAVAILLVLVEHNGHVVAKSQLMEAVWPDTFVEEANLTQHISTLRKALADGGSDYIETIPKRGYRFVAPVNTPGFDPAVVLTERTRTSLVIEEEIDADGRTAREQPAGLRWGWAALLIAALLGVAAGLSYWQLGSRPVVPFEERDWILVLDFENQTGDPRFDRALLTAFTVALDQSRHINVYSRSRIGSTLKRMSRSADTVVTESLGAEIARREGIRALVACSITRTGQQYAVLARIVDPQRQVTIKSFTERAEGEGQILDALERIGEEVRHALGESLFAISQASRPLPEVTTSSLPALQAYADGLHLWNKREFQEALARFQQAVEIDPDFAMAHVALGSAFYSFVLSDPQQGKNHYEKALQLTTRVTDREQSLVRARYAKDAGRVDEALRLFATHLQTYPNDLGALSDQAYLLMASGKVEEAAESYQAVLTIDPNSASAWINLATCRSSLDRDAEALQAYEAGFALEPTWITSGNLNHEYGFTLVGAGQPEKAREVFRLALSKPETKNRALRSLALLDMYQGKYSDAAGKLRQAIRLEAGPVWALSRAREHLFLSQVREAQGNQAEQLRELHRARRALSETRPVPWMSLRLGAAYARAGAVAEATQLLEESRPGVDPKDASAMMELHRLEGELELARGNSAHASELLRLASQGVVGQLTLLPKESVAHLYQATGQADAAITAYEQLQATPSWIGWEAQQSWLASHYVLAELYAGQGDTQAPMRLLDKLLELWVDADDDLPLLRDAHRLRGELGKEPSAPK